MSIEQKIEDVKQKAMKFRNTYISRYTIPGKDQYLLNMLASGEEIHAEFQNLVKDLTQGDVKVSRSTLADVFFASSQHIHRVAKYAFYYYEVRYTQDRLEDFHNLLKNILIYSERSLVAMKLAFQCMPEDKQTKMDRLLIEYVQDHEMISKQLTLSARKTVSFFKENPRKRRRDEVQEELPLSKRAEGEHAPVL